jgi:protocatechuate 3,4-dioxygenase alpha subunit
MKLTATTWQTVGPFFRIGLERFYVSDLTAPSVPGERIEIRGRVLDGDQQPVPDAIIEIWQADAHGKYFQQEAALGDSETREINKTSAPAFRGYGRVATSDDGEFHFKTIKPGAVPAPDGSMQAPHIAVSIFMRGLLRRLTTRIYFPGDAANANDFVLHKVDPARWATLVAKSSAADKNLLEWNVILQGTNETVFFDC